MLSNLKRKIMGETEKPTNKTEPEIIIKRTHYTRTEIETIQALINEKYSTKEIAQKTNRTVSAISNLKHKLKQNFKAEKEIPTLIKQRDALNDETLELKISLSLENAKLDRLKEEITDYETLKKEYSELKKAIEYYQANKTAIGQELRALVNAEANAVAIMKIFQFLEKR